LAEQGKTVVKMIGRTVRGGNMIGWDCPSPDLTLSAADMPRERRRKRRRK
jgi:hypothetical protein